MTTPAFTPSLDHTSCKHDLELVDGVALGTIVCEIETALDELLAWSDCEDAGEVRGTVKQLVDAWAALGFRTVAEEATRA